MTLDTITLNDFTIVFVAEEHYVKIRAYKAVGWLDDDKGTKLYQRRGAPTSPDFVESIEEAEVYLSGSIKWDGCSDLYLGDSGYFNFCGKRSAMELGKLVEYIYDRCAKYLKVREKGNEDLYF